MEIILNAVILLLFGVIGFILKAMFNDIKSHGADIGKLKGKIDLVNQGATQTMEKLSEITTLKIEQLTQSVNKQCGQVKEVSQKVNELSGQIKSRDTAIIREIKDLKKVLK